MRISQLEAALKTNKPNMNTSFRLSWCLCALMFLAALANAAPAPSEEDDDDSAADESAADETAADVVDENSDEAADDDAAEDDMGKGSDDYDDVYEDDVDDTAPSEPIATSAAPTKAVDHPRPRPPPTKTRILRRYHTQPPYSSGANIFCAIPAPLFLTLLPLMHTAYYGGVKY